MSGPGPEWGPTVAALAAAIRAHNEDEAQDRARFFLTAARGRPAVAEDVGRQVALRHGDMASRFTVYRLAPARYRVEVPGAAVEVDFHSTGASSARLALPIGAWTVRWSDQPEDPTVEVDGTEFEVARDDRGIVCAPAPAVVLSMPVSEGEHVKQGDPLVVLEAMKMELAVTAPGDGWVRRAFVRPNVQVDAGEPLVQVVPRAEPAWNGDLGDMRSLAEASARAYDHPDTCRSVTGELRSLMLGFDVASSSIRTLGTRWASACGRSERADGNVGAEADVLAIFADVASLTQRALTTDEDGGESMRAQEEELLTYLRYVDAGHPALSVPFVESLRRALAHYGVASLERTPELEEALYHLYRSHRRLELQVPAVMAILDRLLDQMESTGASLAPHFQELLDRIAASTRARAAAVSDLARELRYRAFDQPLMERVRRRAYLQAEADLAALGAGATGTEREARIRSLIECPQPLKRVLTARMQTAVGDARTAMLEALARRYYRIRDVRQIRTIKVAGRGVVTASYPHQGSTVHLVATHGAWPATEDAAAAAARAVGDLPSDGDVVVDLYLWRTDPPEDPDGVSERLAAALNGVSFGRPIRRIVVALSGPGPTLKAATMEHFTYRPSSDGYGEEKLYRGLHPMMGKRLELWRLSNFRIDRLPSVEDVYLFRGVARDNPKDERLFALAEVRDLTPLRDGQGRVLGLPALELMLTEALEGIRLHQSHRPANRRLQWNRVLLAVWPPLDLPPLELLSIVHKLAPLAEGLGLEKVVVRAGVIDERTGKVNDRVIHISNPVGREFVLRFDDPADQPIRPLSGYMQKVVQTRQRGLTYPYEIIKMITPPSGAPADYPPGDFQEFDLDPEGRLTPVSRPYGENQANVVVGVITNLTPAYPEGMVRVAILGDPSRSLGSLAEPECSRIIAALDLAQRMRAPVEWFAVSAGAKISMSSGTENMDWIGRVLRRLIEFTQDGGEVNIVVCGINVGAQPYWNAEATMLMHTKGILVMTPGGAMVLTGKQALDYSGGVSAEDNFGIGGYDRVMGPNGQAQYWARDLDEACRILFRHYEHTYVRPDERFPRSVPTADPADRDVSQALHRTGGGESFDTIGDVFSSESNPDRKKPFDMRSVMRAVLDQDHQSLERWAGMKDGEIGVVWDAHLGGTPVCMIGIESRPIPRRDLAPADGPDYWTAGTLFPISSKKIARAINSASGNRPVVVLANLSGFDGSPESLRNLQLEYGAEIGRAVVNFKGPMVFCVVGRYHGGAFVVFSRTLNENLEIAAVEGSFASVIGGAPAAAVVFAREVDERTSADPRVQEVERAHAVAGATEKGRLGAKLEETRAEVRSEKLGELAGEYDRVHTIYRAREMGSVDEIIPPSRLRPYLVEAVQRGIHRELDRQANADHRARPERRTPSRISAG